VIYLNGAEINALHMPEGESPMPPTPAVPRSKSAAKGRLPNHRRRLSRVPVVGDQPDPGRQRLAVEVHDVNAVSVEVAFGLALGAQVLRVPVITTQPSDTTVEEDQPFTLQVPRPAIRSPTSAAR